MADPMRFDEAKARLEEIVTEVRKKETPLERSIDLLEEGVRLANLCTERIDDTYAADTDDGASAAGDGSATEASAEGGAEARVLE